MRFLWALPLCIAACRSDPPATTVAPAPSASTKAVELDTTPLPGAPSLSAIGGWWIVAEGHVGGEDPGAHPGSAWWFGPDKLRLLVGDVSDRRPITTTKVEGDELRLTLDGADVMITRRDRGIALRNADETTRIPLRRATPAEISAIAAGDKKRDRMQERACEKAVECCQAALTKGVVTKTDCAPLLGKPDLTMCIQAIAAFKGKAATAKVSVPECLPDK